MEYGDHLSLNSVAITANRASFQTSDEVVHMLLSRFYDNNEEAIIFK